MTQKKQVLQDLQVFFLIFNCQTPALINAFVPFDENSIRPVTVKLIYLKPMYSEEYQHMKSNEIAEEVKRRIEEAVARYE